MLLTKELMKHSLSNQLSSICEQPKNRLSSKFTIHVVIVKKELLINWTYTIVAMDMKLMVDGLLVTLQAWNQDCSL
jgi:hypothetical protein